MAVSCCSMSLLVKQGILFTDITNCNSMDLLLFTCNCQGRKAAIWRNLQGVKTKFFFEFFLLAIFIEIFFIFPNFCGFVYGHVMIMQPDGMCISIRAYVKFCQYCGLRLVRPITPPFPNLCGPQCTLSSVTSMTFLVLLRQAGTRNVCIDYEHC